MNIVELEINEIESLWKNLNDLHFKHSTHFKTHFQNLKFEDRTNKIISNEHVKIFGIKDGNDIAGYTIATVNSEAGEIYSLFVDINYRGKGFGQKLMKHSIEWLKAKQCENIRVYVAEGNEQALPFYESIGFKHRFHVLQLS
ncbi:GNAT family N-acetyltransferase [Photobacterium sp. CCB-ST2H9]|uniref:GNAT family N-acetyltransferase n=1 Tax=Photobacterium sp. CCB-ST2H9 TaxID=2912855 RepID=UPI00200605F0|nr:GNAT family N-acetyltransferase [Photobacterium sp. CCB-ST2H9]UTM60030.1 GNAT family N-acetyltransferase [Photobacterium sp. CCB-ST2H9]